MPFNAVPFLLCTRTSMSFASSVRYPWLMKSYESTLARSLFWGTDPARTQVSGNSQIGHNVHFGTKLLGTFRIGPGSACPGVRWRPLHLERTFESEMHAI